ncbi:hypothetical protein C1H46_016739 [Malus baccata]|uniref:Uncharacterized protein n=1 Tax=Malus baccata TaxID=106549 RepID=A0A540MGC9_MALBA|nr:hypothetical protein C1H46_016739 [Malus baccata]
MTETKTPFQLVPFAVVEYGDFISSFLTRVLRLFQKLPSSIAQREGGTVGLDQDAESGITHLSEWSATDADCLIREIRPDAVIAQVGHSTLTEIQSEESVLCDGFDKSFPTSMLRVLKRCFLEKVNKERYEDIAGHLVLQEIFGVGFHGHFFGSQEGGSGAMGKALANAQKMLYDVNGGEAVDTNVISEVYALRIAVEGLRISLNNAGRLPINKIREPSLNQAELSDLPVEDKSHVLLEKLLTDKPLVAVGAGATAVLGASSLSKAATLKFPASTLMKVVTFKVPASLKLFLSQTHKTVGFALSKTLGPSKMVAPGVKSTTLLKATASAEKIRVAAHSVTAAAEKTSFSAMRTAFYQIMRKQHIRKIGVLPWATFGCSIATCAGLVAYGDGIECAAESLPAAPSTASLGRGIQSLHLASQEIARRDSMKLLKSIESLMYRLKKVRTQ